MTATTCSFDPTALENTLFISFELGEVRWILSFTSGFGEQVLRRSVRSRTREAVLGAIEAMKERLGLAPECRVGSCYEAGRDGFWLHRFLTPHRVENLGVDSSSIEGSRRARRAKTDRLDGESLLDLLLRHRAGRHKKVGSVVRVPTVQQEDRRHLHRELASAKKDRTRGSNRMKGLLANQGLTLDVKKDVPVQLASFRQWDGGLLPAGLRARLYREWERVQFYTDLVERLEAERRELLRKAEDPVIEKVLQLNHLKGIGVNSAWLYTMELFGWRELRNRKEVGSIVGLAPTPHDSGQSERERGISKAGNRHCGPWRSRSPGAGSASNRTASCPSGISDDSVRGASV